MSLRYKGGLISPSVNPLAANVTTSPNVAQYNGVFTLQQQGQALTSGQWCTDPYYRNTTLLLHADGKSNGSQNNTFLDSSTNNFTVTRNGNTTQGSFTPYGPTWSNYFDGSSAYLTATNNTAYAFGTGDFTVEAWVYLVSTPSGQMVVGSTYQSTSSGFTFSIESNVLKVRMLGDPVVVSGSTTVTPNAWHHVAVSRSGTSLKVFLDGAQDGSATNSDNVALNSTAFNIARLPNSSGYLAGYVSNLRVVKGTAVYTAAFFPSTIPLTAITNTSLLTCQSNRFVDNSTNAFTITVGNTPAVQRFSPFAPQYQYTPAVIGGSGYFDGSDTLSLSANTAFVFGTGDFTIECWVYATVWNTTDIIQNLSSGNLSWTLEVTGGNIYLAGWNTNFIVGGTAPSLNAWHHIAVCRSGTTLSMFIDGTRTATTTSSTDFSSNNNLTIGNFSSSYVNGYLSDIRLVKGTAVYNPSSSTCTVPTAPLTAVSGTSLLLNTTNAGIYDNAMMNDLETVGNAQVSTSVVKYGSGSLYFDGSGDYLVAPPSDVTNFGTGDFTVEFWVRGNPSGSYVQTIGKLYNLADNGAWRVGTRYASADQVYFSRGNGSTFEDTVVAVNVNDGSWHHVAVTRASGTLSIYVDGIVRTTTTQTGTCSVSNSLYVGYNYRDGQYFSGYLDDIRITKGVARYTGNFIPPKVAFANQ